MFVKALSRKRRTGAVPVYLNVYDLTTINGYAYWIGLGIYHSGVQVHGVEYAYGAHDHATSGIFEGEPRECPGFQFRKSILIGRTDLGPREVRSLMDAMAGQYTGSTYNLISKNCNHFCDDACVRITGNPIPRWVNRLANLGFFCNCMLPEGLHVAVTAAKEEKGRSVDLAEGEEKVKLRIKSPKYTVPHVSSPSAPANGSCCIVALHSASPSSSSSSSSSVTSTNGEPKSSRKSRWRRTTSCSSPTLVVTTPASAL